MRPGLGEAARSAGKEIHHHDLADGHEAKSGNIRFEAGLAHIRRGEGQDVRNLGGSHEIGQIRLQHDVERGHDRHPVRALRDPVRTVDFGLIGAINVHPRDVADSPAVDHLAEAHGMARIAAPTLVDHGDIDAPDGIRRQPGQDLDQCGGSQKAVGGRVEIQRDQLLAGDKKERGIKSIPKGGFVPIGRERLPRDLAVSDV